MNTRNFRQVLLGVFLGAIVSLPVFSQPAAPGAGGGGRGAAGGGRGGGGGGRGGVSFTPTQASRLAEMAVPEAISDAVASARIGLARASLTLPADPDAMRAAAADLGMAELAQSMMIADEWARIQPLNLSPEQLAAVITNNGIPRGGNTSPGGTYEYSDYTGYVSLFDGRTLNGWSYEDDAWTIDNGHIQMDTMRKAGQHHIHFTGLPGVSPILRDFDFKVEFVAREGGFNGGVQYRSRLLTGHGPNRSIYDPATMADPLGRPLPAGITNQPAANAAGITGQPWQVSGYQFDITGNNMGSLYEGQGRGVIVNAGEVVQLLPGGLRFVVGRAADDPASYVHPNLGLEGEWNQVHLIIRGNTLVHMLNGHVITVAIDDDPIRRAFQGILSLQCEGGAIWYRNVYLKHFNPIVAPGM
jgi:hypothetical protein